MDLLNTQLRITVSPAEETILALGGQGNRLVSNNLANVVLWTQGGLAGHGRLNIADGVRNFGTLKLESVSSNWISEIAVEGTLTNMPEGVIEAHLGTGGARNLAGSLTHAGRINLLTSFALGSSGAVHVNSGDIDLSGISLLIIGDTFTNDTTGTINGTGTIDQSGVNFINLGTIGSGISF